MVSLEQRTDVANGEYRREMEKNLHEALPIKALNTKYLYVYDFARESSCDTMVSYGARVPEIRGYQFARCKDT